MNTSRKTTTILEDPRINIKIKLAVLWTTVIFLFVYVDIYTLHVPGHIEEIIAGEVAGFEITQAWLLGITVLMAITSLMVFLSLTLKPIANRWANIIFGIIWIGIVLSSLFVGETLVYYVFASIVQVVLPSLIVWYAWKWPKQEP